MVFTVKKSTRGVARRMRIDARVARPERMERFHQAHPGAEGRPDGIMLELHTFISLLDL
jgi:hypothetical protein